MSEEVNYAVRSRNILSEREIKLFGRDIMLSERDHLLKQYKRLAGLILYTLT